MAHNSYWSPAYFWGMQASRLAADTHLRKCFTFVKREEGESTEASSFFTHRRKSAECIWTVSKREETVWFCSFGLDHAGNHTRRIRWAVFCLWWAWQLCSRTAVKILLTPTGRDLKGIGASLIRTWPIITVLGVAKYKWSRNGTKFSWLPVPSIALSIHLQRAGGAALFPIILPFMWHDTFSNFLCSSGVKYSPGKEI